MTFFEIFVIVVLASVGLNQLLSIIDTLCKFCALPPDKVQLIFVGTSSSPDEDKLKDRQKRAKKYRRDQ